MNELVMVTARAVRFDPSRFSRFSMSRTFMIYLKLALRHCIFRPGNLMYLDPEAIRNPLP
jgi:hypothetical protein